MDHYFTNNQNLRSEIKELSYVYGNYQLTFFSDNGVFSKDRIDYGSHVLIDTFIKSRPERGNILDVGCGYGFMGITLSKVLDTHVTMIDVNKRALHLTKMNIDKNKATCTSFESDGYQNVDGKFDYILTNPPVHAGKDILLNILVGAKDHLKEGGELWYVLRKDQGAKSIEKILNEHYEVQNIEKSKGFYIFRCTIH